MLWFPFSISLGTIGIQDYHYELPFSGNCIVCGRPTRAYSVDHSCSVCSAECTKMIAHWGNNVSISN